MDSEKMKGAGVEVALAELSCCVGGAAAPSPGALTCNSETEVALLVRRPGRVSRSNGGSVCVWGGGVGWQGVILGPVL